MKLIKLFVLCLIFGFNGLLHGSTSDLKHRFKDHLLELLLLSQNNHGRRIAEDLGENEYGALSQSEVLQVFRALEPIFNSSEEHRVRFCFIGARGFAIKAPKTLSVKSEETIESKRSCIIS